MIKVGDLVVCIHPKEYEDLTYPTGLEKGVAYRVVKVNRKDRPGGGEIWVEGGPRGSFRPGRFLKIHI